MGVVDMASTNGHKSISTQYDALSKSLTSPHREIYTRALYRLCLKFTTSEDEDEGKLEPATAFWTIFGHETSIGNGDLSLLSPSSSATDHHRRDEIVRKMDDSMSGPNAGVVAVLPFLLPPSRGAGVANHHISASTSPNNSTNNLSTPALLALTQRHAANAGLSCGWHVYGDRGDAAIRCGQAQLLSSSKKATTTSTNSNIKVLSMDALRWELCPGASFAAGNSVFIVDDVNYDLKQVTFTATKGPIRNRTMVISHQQCPFVFGRAHEADLCIMDRELSRRHGAILFSATTGKRGAFVLVDLQSTNGSYMRLIGPYGARGIGALSIGDEFIVGRTGFRVHRFDYGYSESIGARPTMEDRLVVIQSLLSVLPQQQQQQTKHELTELAMTSFCGVFDGHGGDECSEFLSQHLAATLARYMLRDREALQQAILQSSSNNANVNYNNGNAATAEDAASETMRRIIKQSYLAADAEFIQPRGAPQSGSTAATVILFGRRLFAANVGDSRVVLCRSGGQCVELTSDHKPSRPDEAARVRAAGGFILHKRVMGELAITRAFGDKSFKMGIKAMLEEDEDDMLDSHTHNATDGNGEHDYMQNSSSFSSQQDPYGSDGQAQQQQRDLTAPLVSAEPEIASTILSHSDEFCLLACDGLFDVFRSQDAIALARQELINHKGEPAEVARILSDQAIRVRRSRDNVSILIIVFRPFWND